MQPETQIAIEVYQWATGALITTILALSGSIVYLFKLNRKLEKARIEQERARVEQERACKEEMRELYEDQVETLKQNIRALEKLGEDR